MPQETAPPSGEHRIRMTLVAADVPCSRGVKVGDEWDITDGPPAGFCHWAWHSVYPFFCVLKYGGSFPWQQPGDQHVVVACPDPDAVQRFRLEIVR